MKKFHDNPKLLKSENDPGGGKRAWWEVADEEAIMLKFKAGTTVEKMTQIAQEKLDELKQRDLLESQLQLLEQQAQEIRDQLGV